MANYNTITKIFVANVTSTEISSTASTLAKTVNDYVQTLDDSTNEIISISSAVCDGTPNVNTGRLFITIIHKG
jgi:hypothetical protein